MAGTRVLTGSALVLHDLGLAAGFGGALFGKIALNPAVKAIPDKNERSEVSHKAWEGIRWVHVASLGAAALTLVTGRAGVSGRGLGRDLPWLILAKDVLVGAFMLTTLASMITGAALGREAERGNRSIELGNRFSNETPARRRALLRAVNTLGTLNLVAAAGVIGLTAVLNLRPSVTPRWRALARALP
jgi:hypothetical protein